MIELTPNQELRRTAVLQAASGIWRFVLQKPTLLCGGLDFL
jgi:hypothetical protein